jgi:hypothetical protein
MKRMGIDNRKMRQIRERKSGTVELSFEPRNTPNTQNDTKTPPWWGDSEKKRCVRATLDRCFHTAPTTDLILDILAQEMGTPGSARNLVGERFSRRD